MSHKLTNNKLVQSQDSEVTKNNKINPLESGKATGSSLEEKPAKKEKTVPASIRLSKPASDALVSLMEKYTQNKAAMTSAAIIAYAKQSAAAPILHYRMMDNENLFALQAAASDIKRGLSNLRHDLYKARKSARDVAELRALYADLSTTYQRVLLHAEETLTLMDKECLLFDLLDTSDYELLTEEIVRLEHAKPKTRRVILICNLYLKIIKTLLR